MLILGIETSCDETAAAVFQDGCRILSNVVSSQIKLHTPYGGVVPEIASRAHMENIIPVIQKALEEAKVEGKDLDAIAVTTGPGLITSLMIGVDTAKTLAYAWEKPILGVNHIEGHIYSVKLKAQSSKLKSIKLPAMCLTVSGGHTMLVLIKEWGNYEVIGETIDDSCGEAFDKVAKLLGLGYPGGPIIEKLARGGGRQAFSFPRPILNQGNFNFSFSGLKTAVLYQARRIKKMDKKVVQDICASFQEAAFEVLVIKTLRAARKFKVSTIILAGGVAANQALQNFFKKSLSVNDYKLLITDFPTDNAAMIAGAAYPRVLKEDYDDWHSLQADPNLKL
ncbi:MAG: tRNA (adenosine(37)-N6)-threonylcarbamoyltransferase complex transferase subunit TsaD [Patescibacteria group bacterium]|nr:tRNA (adenosine(37)-N6)-threonylcarbamoyltransferase complex transferase subunit TsaD [Patescibacteria group bacterium]